MSEQGETTEALVELARRFGTDTAEVEIKSGVGGLPTTAAETVSAFANGAGGTLLLGLVEKENFDAADGFDARRIRDALAGVCADKLEPPIRDQPRIEDLNGAPVVRLDVIALDPVEKPCFVKARGIYNGSFIRGGDGDRRLNHYETTQLMSNRQQPSDDLIPVEAAAFADLSADLIARVLSRVRRQSPRAFRDLSDELCLVRLGALVESNGTLRPTLAGLLSLGEYPQQFFPQLFISFVALPGTAMGETTSDGRRFLDNQSLNGPIPEMVDDAVSAVVRNMRQSVIIRDGRRTDRYDYPIDVLRELLVNAVMHRDYGPGSRGTQVQVQLYPDRLVVKSPGGLWGGVEPGQLGTSDVSSSRNAVLAKLLSDLPFSNGDPVCEDRGSGLPTVVRELRAAGMSPPEFDASPAQIIVTIPQQALLGPETIDWIGSLALSHLTDAQQLALAMIRANGSVSNEMLRSWGVERHAATDALTDLVSRGVLTKFGGRRYASYRLAVTLQDDDLFSSVDPIATSPAPPSAMDTDLAAVVEAIRAGYVTSRGIATQLGIDYQAALRRIRKLRNTGVIEETATRHSSRQSYRLVDAPRRG